MPYIPWGDHRGGRLELAMLDCSAPHSNPSADPPQPGENCLLISAADFHLPVHKLPEFTGTLHEAAGLAAALESPPLQSTLPLQEVFANVSFPPGCVRQSSAGLWFPGFFSWKMSSG